MAVQVLPFIYTAMFVLLFSAYTFCSGAWLDIVDYFFFVSPVVVVAHLIYSRMLMMCKWHRRACAMPLIPQAMDLFDTYVYNFGRCAWLVAVITITITLILFLIAIYRVFFTDGGKFC